MGDERAKHLKRLKRLRHSARGWSVRAGLLAGATAVLVPYQGLGLPDALWAAAAGGSIAITVWRWIDYRALAAEPVPPAVDPMIAGAQARQRITNAVRRLPVGRTVVDEFERQRAMLRFRGLAVAEFWRRLDRASMMLSSVAHKLGEAAEGTVVEAVSAERALRDLCERLAVVERTLQMGPASASLRPTHDAMTAQLDSGVEGYEQFVAAAVGCVAEDAFATVNLAEATAFLRGVAEGLADFRGAPRTA
jgi:hypothetical protein